MRHHNVLNTDVFAVVILADAWRQHPHAVAVCADYQCLVDGEPGSHAVPEQGESDASVVGEPVRDERV